MHSIETAWLGEKKKKEKIKERNSAQRTRAEKITKTEQKHQKVFITSWKCCYCKYFSVSVISSTGKLRDSCYKHTQL